MPPEDFTATQIEMLGRRWREDPSPHLSLQLADLYRQNGQLSEALPVLEEGLDAHPESVSVRVALGRYRMEAGDPAAAAEALKQVVDADPGHLVANKLLVRAHLALGEYQSATDRLELYGLLNDSDPELESLRIAVAGRSALPPLGGATTSSEPPFGDAEAASGASDLRSIPPPSVSERTLAGALDSEPFQAVAAPAGGLTGIFPSLGVEAVSVEAVGVEPAVEQEAAPLPDSEPDPTPDVEAPVSLESGADAEPEAADDEVPASHSTPRDVAEPAPPADVGFETVVQEGAFESTAPEPVDAGAGATATLGALYLSQGHLDDAEETFRQVLARDPDDAEARAGLAELEAMRSGYAANEDDLETESADSPKISALRDYLGRIRSAADRLA